MHEFNEDCGVNVVMSSVFVEGDRVLKPYNNNVMQLSCFAVELTKNQAEIGFEIVLVLFCGLWLVKTLRQERLKEEEKNHNNHQN
jgi:hypothetical protein